MKPIRIESEKNTFYRKCLSLLHGKGIKKHCEFLLMGSKFVREQYQAQYNKHPQHAALIFSDNHSWVPAIPIQTYSLPQPLFDELDIFGTKFPILLSPIPKVLPWDPSQEGCGLELYSAIGDPANLGALLRSAAAFGVHKVVLLKESASLFHPKALRSSAGSSLNLLIEAGPSISELHIVLHTLALSGKNIGDYQWPKNCSLLMGQEGPGLPTHQDSWVPLKIPMTSNVESLNAMVASSIALYSYSLQHPLKN